MNYLFSNIRSAAVTMAEPVVEADPIVEVSCVILENAELVIRLTRNIPNVKAEIQEALERHVRSGANLTLASWARLLWALYNNYVLGFVGLRAFLFRHHLRFLKRISLSKVIKESEGNRGAKVDSPVDVGFFDEESMNDINAGKSIIPSKYTAVHQLTAICWSALNYSGGLEKLFDVKVGQL